MYDLQEYLEPINLAFLNNDEAYNKKQIGSLIGASGDQMTDVEVADIVFVGISENRGGGLAPSADGANAIRSRLYKLFFWHEDIKLADVGNIETGATVADSYAAIKTVVTELLKMGKTVVLFGGSHDNTLAQYNCYKELKKVVEATVIDSMIDLNQDAPLKSESFLMDMLTTEPNFIRHYNHIGFQSYFVNPVILESMDKLRFDCFRVGMAKEKIEEMEPVIRNSNMVSIDINAIKYSDAPANQHSPNGFTGEEACILARFAGMSSKLDTLGIYGYRPERDVNELTALQIAQMIWYFIDGKSRSKQEASFDERHNFNEFHIGFTEADTTFLQSKRTGRWWMQLPDTKMIPCSYNDYVTASNNQIPERWLRAQERE
jgi:formiminoglutamase